jgi:small redox-active disulfide protein 2
VLKTVRHAIVLHAALKYSRRNQMSLDIKVLGSGCANCKRLYSEAERAVAQLSIAATLTKVENIKEIMVYKILATPALVINGEVKSAGRIPNADEITTWLATADTKQ